MSARSTAVLGAILSIAASLASGQTATSPGPAFRLIDAKNLTALQQELDRAAADGYVVMLAWPGYERVILGRGRDDQPRPVYRVFSGEKEIRQRLAQGYRAVPDTLDVYDGTLSVIARQVEEIDRCEPLLLKTTLTGRLTEELEQAATKGFRIVGMASDDSGHAALLERVMGGVAGVNRSNDVALIAANRQDTLQKELSDRVSAGYRIVGSSSWKETLIALERREEAAVDYRVLSTTKSATLEQEMNAAAAQGFHYTPSTLQVVQKGAMPLLGRFGSEYVVVMEKHAGERPHEYFIVAAKRTGTIIKEFDEAIARGLVPVASMIGYSEQETLVVFDRPQR